MKFLLKQQPYLQLASSNLLDLLRFSQEMGRIIN